MASQKAEAFSVENQSVFKSAHARENECTWQAIFGYGTGQKYGMLNLKVDVQMFFSFLFSSIINFVRIHYAMGNCQALCPTLSLIFEN